MGSNFSSNNSGGGGGSMVGGSGGLDEMVSPKEPAAITPVARGGDGELIYNIHDQNILAASGGDGGRGNVGGSIGTDPVLPGGWRRKWQIRFLAAGVAALWIILVVLIVIIALMLAGGKSDDDTNNKVATGTTERGGGDNMDEHSRGIDTGIDGDGDGAATTITPTVAPSVVAAVSLLPSTLLPTLVPSALLPTSVAIASPPPSLAPKSSPCSLCGDGLPVPEEFLDEYAVASTTNGRNFTCRELEIALATFRDDCFVLQLVGSYRCGCIQPHPRAVCDLCWDGSLPPDEFFNAQIDELGSLGVPLTCEELYLEAARIHNTSQACFIHQSRFGTRCGCPPITRPSPTVSPSLGQVAPTVSPTSTPTMAPIGPCTLCADGSLVQAEYHSSFALSTTAGRNLTCLDLKNGISSFNDPCLHLQLFGTYNCGCPAPPFLPDTCPVCPNNDRGLPPPEFRDVALDELSSLGVPLRCRDLYISSFLNTNRTDLDCRLYRSRFAPQCGCDLVANKGGGDDDGGDDGSPSLPPATASLPPPSSEPLSSSTESPTAPPIPEPTSPSSSSSASPLPVSASPPSVTSSPTVQANCTLCADGRIPENPNNAFLPTNPLTCLEVSLLAPFLASRTETTTPEEACLALQALGALECGCGYPHPQWECLLCDTLPDKETRDFILVSTPEEDGSLTNFTCGGAIVALSSSQNETECEELTSIFGPACGCV